MLDHFTYRPLIKPLLNLFISMQDPDPMEILGKKKINRYNSKITTYKIENIPTVYKIKAIKK